ncbi:TPA: hypothetical protein SK283_002713 [Yersinia enterocolitica]|nr:hypothetical protein [Yersinia enterocolitica]
MSAWQTLLFFFFVFLVALFYSFKKELSRKRTVMRFIAIGIAVCGGIIFFILYNKMQELKVCPSDVNNFYAKNGTLCFNYQNVSKMLNEQKQMEIASFRIVNPNLVVIETPNNGRFKITKESGEDGFYINPLE